MQPLVAFGDTSSKACRATRYVIESSCATRDILGSGNPYLNTNFRSEILYSTTDGQQGNFSGRPEITSQLGSVNVVKIGIDENLDGTLDSNEVSFIIDLHTINLDNFTLQSRRTAGGPVEPGLTTVRDNEHFEIGGTFQFNITENIGQSNVLGPAYLMRWEFYDEDNIDELLISGAGRSFATNMVPDDVGNAYVLYYVDVNNNQQRDSWEASAISKIFHIMEKRVLEYNVWISSALNATTELAALQTDVAYANQILQSRDTEADYRAAVEIRLIGTPLIYTANGSVTDGTTSFPTPDPVNSQSDQDKMFAAADLNTIVATSGLTVGGNVIRGVGHMPGSKVLLNMNNKTPETLAHEIGHNMGLDHPDGLTNDHIITAGATRNAGANLLSKKAALAYDKGPE